MASLVEYFKMPRREIEAKFTRSEVFLVSWRSQEMSVELTKGMRNADKTPKKSAAPEKSDDLPAECFTNGEPDTRKMTLAQVQKFWRGQQVER